MLLEVDDMQKAISNAFEQAKAEALKNISEITQDAIEIMVHNKKNKLKFSPSVSITLDIDAENNRTIDPTGTFGWPTINKKVPFSANQVPMTGDYDPDQGKLDLDGGSPDGMPVTDATTEPPDDYDGPGAKEK